MESKIIDDKLVIKLSILEASDLSHGKTVIDSNSPIASDALIQVSPLNDYDPEYKPLPKDKFLSKEYLERVNITKTMARVFLTGDLQIFVPPEIPMHVKRSSISLKRSDVETPQRDTRLGTGLRFIPKNGVNLIIDGEINGYT